MKKKMETTVIGYIGTTARIQSLITRGAATTNRESTILNCLESGDFFEDACDHSLSMLLRLERASWTPRAQVVKIKNL